MPKIKKQKGLTLIELMMTMLIATIVVFGTAVLLVDNFKSYAAMYGRLHRTNTNPNSAVLDDATEARRMFDYYVRRASIAYPVIINPAGTSLTVDYRGTPSSPVTCVVFNWDTGAKKLTINCYNTNAYGNPTGSAISTQTISNVTSTSGRIFKASGRSVQMLFTFDDGKQKFDVFSTAYLISQ